MWRFESGNYNWGIDHYKNLLIADAIDCRCNIWIGLFLGCERCLFQA